MTLVGPKVIHLVLTIPRHAAKDIWQDKRWTAHTKERLNRMTRQIGCG